MKTFYLLTHLWRTAKVVSKKPNLGEVPVLVQVTPRINPTSVRLDPLSIFSRQFDLRRFVVQMAVMICLLVTAGVELMWGATYTSVATLTDGQSYILVAGGKYAITASIPADNWIGGTDVSGDISGSTLTTTATDIVWVAKKYTSGGTTTWSFKNGTKYIQNNSGNTYRNMTYNVTESKYSISSNKIYSTGSGATSKYLNYVADPGGFRMYDSNQGTYSFTFYELNCTNKVTVSKGSSSSNGSITTITGSPVETCSSTAADRQVSIIVTPNTGYTAPTDLTLTSSSGGITSTKVSRTDNGNGTFTFVYRYNQNNNGTATYDVTCVAKTCTISLNDQTPTTAASPTSITATYNANTNLTGTVVSTLPTKTGYNFGGYYTGTNGSGVKLIDEDGVVVASASGGGNTYTDASKIWKYDGGITLYAYWLEISYENYVFSCAELTLTGPTEDLVFITSAANKTVRSQEAFHIEGSGLTPSTALTFTISDPSVTSKFAFKKADGSALSTESDGTIDTDFYVYYTPGAGDTSDGMDQFSSLTASVSGAKPKTVTLTTKTVIGRHLPANFVVAAKVDGRWYALPANKANGNPAPIAIRVDNNANPTTAYCVNTNSYTLYQDNTANSAKVILGMTNKKSGENSYALFGSSSDAKLGYSTGLVNGDLGDQYKWTLKQTATSISSIGDVKYTMRVTNRSYDVCIRTYNSALNWGTYTSGTRVSELRLLTLTTRSAPAMSVMEWGTDVVVLSYSKGGTAKNVQAIIGDGSPTAITLTGLGGDIYKTSTISGLSSNPGKTLTILTTESSTVKEKMLVIPFIVGNGVSKTEQQLREMMPGADATARNAAATLVDVVIRSGGTLTTTTNSGSFANLYVYPGGKAILSNNFKIKTKVYLRGGYSFLDEKATYQYPDLCIKSGTLTLPTVTATATAPPAALFYDLYIDNRYYYTFSMPDTVRLAYVHDETGSDAFNVWVKHYNGATRASGQHVSGWEWYGDGAADTLFRAGVGYEITAQPRVSGRTIAIIRFPVKNGNITSASEAASAPAISVGNYGKTEYDVGSLAANNVGWNFLGNPYLTEYKAVSDTSMIVAYDYQQHKENGVWDGTYEWKTSAGRFITVPRDVGTDYHHEYVKGYTIPAFSAFFFQTETAGTFTMGGTRPQAAAPTRYSVAPVQMPELHIDVMLRGDDEAVEGKAGLIIHDKYEGGLKDFEDVEQWFVEKNELKTYTFADGAALAYNLTNEQTVVQPIPMGYIATVAGEHTYSLNEANDVSSLEHLWLTDYEDGITTDLLVRDYTFITEAGRFDGRFALSAVFKQQDVVTDISDIGNDEWTQIVGVYHDGKTLTLRGLPDNSAVYIYDMTGKLMASSDKLHNIASFNVPTQGVYNIRVVNGDKAVTLRSVIR